jgi:hypothetical protein
MSIPEVCTFRGIRKKVLEETWKMIREAESKGEIITNADYARFVREAWRKAKEEAARACEIR